MSVYIWLVPVLILAMWAYRAWLIWQDAHQLGLDPMHRFGWALLGGVFPSRYWWGIRIAALPQHDRTDLLARETAALGLGRADSVRCPLCGAEVPHAWMLTSKGAPTVARGPIRCPQCDFRLDACRHCAHFLPGSPQTSGTSLMGSDLTFGRCSLYKATQPVEQACTPEIARQLKSRGMETIRAPLPIVDSFMPPDYCKAFAADRKRLKMGGVPWPDARRIALLRLLIPPAAPQKPSQEELPAGDDQWLL